MTMNEVAKAGSEDCRAELKAHDYERSLVDRCLPALTTLNQHGVPHMRLMYLVEDGVVVDSWLTAPRFFDARVLKKDWNSIVEAYSAVHCRIDDAVDAAIESGGHEGASCIVAVHISDSESASGWTITGEIIAMLDHGYEAELLDLE